MSADRIARDPSRYRVTEDAMTTHLVEDRRATLSPWGRGNSKLGPGVYTYSKMPGRIASCPGSTDHCEAVCYAKRITNPWVLALWRANQERGSELPPLPDDARLVRGHVSGDFDSVEYIEAWAALAEARPEVSFWFYTRSFRVPELLPALERLRALSNVQMWASMDADADPPPKGWRRAWLDSDPRATAVRIAKYAYETEDGVVAPVCPEESGTKPNCEACGYCFRAPADKFYDLVFLEHRPKE